MGARACAVCGEATDDRARFCPACGVRLDAPVVFGDGGADPVEELTRRGPGLTAILVPLAVLAVIGIGVLALTSGGDPSTDDEAAVPEPSPSVAPTAASTATPEPAPTPTQPPTATPVPTALPGRVAGEAEVDLGALPETEATHLAVARGLDLAFLDLSSGEWVVHEAAEPAQGLGLSELLPFADGVVRNGSGAVVYTPVEGSARVLAEGWAIGTNGATIYVRSVDPQQVVDMVDVEGRVVRTLELPAFSEFAGVLSTGELVVAVAGRVFLVDEAGQRRVAAGLLLGVAADRILLHTCTDDLVCQFELVGPTSGERLVLDDLNDAEGFPQLIARDRVIVFGFASPEGTVYRIEGSELVPEGDAPTGDPFQAARVEALTVATDTTGLYARLEGERVRFHGPTGESITEIGLDPLADGFGDYAVAFVTAE